MHPVYLRKRRFLHTGRALYAVIANLAWREEERDMNESSGSNHVVGSGPAVVQFRAALFW